MYKKIIAFLIIQFLCNNFSYSAQIESVQDSIEKIEFISLHSLNGLLLSYDQFGFHVKKEDKIIDIPSYNVEAMLRNISVENLKFFLYHGYLILKRIDEEEYVLEANIKELGGSNAMVAASFIFGWLLSHEDGKFMEWLKEKRKAGAESLAAKAEWDKTFWDRLCELYDVWLNKSLIGMYIEYVVDEWSGIATTIADRFGTKQVNAPIQFLRRNTIREVIRGYEKEVKQRVVEELMIEIKKMEEEEIKKMKLAEEHTTKEHRQILKRQTRFVPYDWENEDRSLASYDWDRDPAARTSKRDDEDDGCIIS